MKIVTIKGLWLLHWRTKFHIKKKITFLDVLDYSEYSDTNISKKIFQQIPQWRSNKIELHKKSQFG